MAAAAGARGRSLSLCLASAGIVKTLAVAAFTLAWTHSIEKVDWQEDWQGISRGLELGQARAKAAGAGGGKRLRRGQGAAAAGAAGRRLVSVAAGSPGDAGSGARQFRRRRRMAA